VTERSCAERDPDERTRIKRIAESFILCFVLGFGLELNLVQYTNLIKKVKSLIPLK
jgi:hypothetical protein